MSSKKIMSNNKKLDIPLAESGMQYTGLSVFELRTGELKEEVLPQDVEVCVVVISGYIDMTIKGVLYANIGNRITPFENAAPYAFYVTAGDSYRLKALTSAEIAICYAPGKSTFKSRIIEPESISIHERGTEQTRRTARDILPESEEGDSLLVVEVITKGGNWSSFPSHRHDEDNMPVQSYLEEIYYHKLLPEVGGFAVQRIYNDDRSVDDVYVVENNTAILVKEGYHPVAVPPGYDLYYLNVMAGPKRVWKFYNDPFFEHLLK